MAYRNIPIPADSSNIRQVQFDDATGKLLITFVRDNAQYVYDGVSGNVADGFTTSGLSAGKYHRLAVINQFPYNRIG